MYDLKALDMILSDCFMSEEVRANPRANLLFLLECKPGAFNCANKRCILAIFRCDGINHCSDKSDENECDGKYYSIRPKNVLRYA